MSNLTGGDVCEILDHPKIGDHFRKWVGQTVVLSRISEYCSNGMHAGNPLGNCPHWCWVGGDAHATWRLLRKLPPPDDVTATKTEETADV